MKSASWIITFDLLSSNVMSNSSNKLGFGFLFFLTKELIGHLSRIGYNEMNKTTFRNKIIAGLRDEGVVIASSKSGYKIPTKSDST